LRTDDRLQPLGTGMDSRGESLYASLRDLIASGDLYPGRRVTEVELSERFGVSRTPVRDALKRLESEGLLSSAPRRGLVVTQLSPQQVSELYAVREVLEAFAARLMAHHASEMEIETLNVIVRREAEAADATTLKRLNRTFHSVIYSAARNRYLVGALDSLSDYLTLLPGTTFRMSPTPTVGVEEHQAIAAAIAARDPVAADSSAREHIRAAAHRRLLMLVEEDGEH
jgi:DNA-binding GntR family transcriptional regulator